MNNQKSLRKGERRECRLLKLSSDLILLVADALALHDQAILAETCKTLRALLSPRIEEAWGDRTRQQHINYLGSLSRQSLEWFCARCGSHHFVSRGVVQRRCRCRCPEADEDRYGCRCPQHDPLYMPLPRGKFRQETVTLALRYRRLGGLSKRQQDDLRRFLAPISFHWGIRVNGRSMHCRLRILPKIAAGKFLVLTEYLLDRRHLVAARAAICFSALVNAVFPDPDPNRPTYHRLRSSLVRSTYQVALKKAGTECTAFCSHCPSEVSVKVTKKPETIVVRVWQDFGTEASLEDSIWHRFNKCSLRDPSNTDAGPSPWRIRQLYESE